MIRFFLARRASGSGLRGTDPGAIVHIPRQAPARRSESDFHQMVMRTVLACLLLAAAAACAAPADESADTLSQRERDSAIGASKLPGAPGVSAAMRAADSAAARNARLDSIARTP
jgi:hypothetical protein